MTPAKHSNQKIIAALAVLVVITVMVIGVKALTKSTGSSKPSTATSVQTSDSSSDDSSTTPAATDNAASDQSTSATHKDGTYTATGKYVSPGGTQSVKVTLTLSGDTVKDANVESGAVDPKSGEYQDDFISGYKPLVVGKKISSIHLSQVSGSSLTSQGFNDAVQQIENQAKA